MGAVSTTESILFIQCTAFGCTSGSTHFRWSGKYAELSDKSDYVGMVVGVFCFILSNYAKGLTFRSKPVTLKEKYQ